MYLYFSAYGYLSLSIPAVYQISGSYSARFDLSIYPPIHQSSPPRLSGLSSLGSLSISLPLSLYLSIYLSISLSLCLCLYLYLYLDLHLYLYLYLICLSSSLSLIFFLSILFSCLSIYLLTCTTNISSQVFAPQSLAESTECPNVPCKHACSW